MKKTIAAFDFDGTLTRTDTFLQFLLFEFGFLACFQGLWKNRAVMIRYAFGRVKNHEAKEAIFSFFFKGMSLNDFDAACRRFALSKIPRQVKLDALEKCSWHRANGHSVVIVSASVRNWIEPWAKNIGIETVIATEADVDDDTLTGRFTGGNCHGPEKARRLLSHFPGRETYSLYSYGDSKGDLEMLALADFSFYRCF
jgi:HAD superfamily hydrolase (TIGR01490 family)